MKRNIFLILLLSLLTSTLLQAQKVRVTICERVVDDTTKILQVAMHSNTEDSFEVRAINFSILFNDSCTKVTEYDSHFITIWSKLINRVFEQKDLAIEHDGHTYNRRWLMGNGYAGMPGTEKLILPRRSEPPIQVLEVTFSSHCKFPIHFEGETHMNQIGDINLSPIKWIVEYVK